MFGLNGKDGLESVKADREGKFKELLDSAALPELSSGFKMKTELINEHNVESEIIAFRNILADLTAYMATPADTPITEFDYNVIQTCTNYEQLHQTFLTISKSVVMRELLIGIIGDAVIANSNSSSAFNLQELVSDAFWDQYNKSIAGDDDAYNESFWTDAEYRVLAIILATTNAFDIKNNNNFFNMELGTTFADVTSYSNLYSNVDNSNPFPVQSSNNTAAQNQVGLRQILQLMNLSNVFDVTDLGGEGGIIDEFFLVNGITFTGAFGTVTGKDAWQEEINDLTHTLHVMKKNELLDANADFGALVEGSSDYEQLTELFVSVSQSVIMREILVGIIGDAIDANSSNDSDDVFTLEKLTSSEFKEQYAKVKAHEENAYDESFWTEAEYRVLAIILASTTSFGMSTNNDIFNMELGTTFADVTSYSNLYSNVDNSNPFPEQSSSNTAAQNQVGLRQILQLMNVSGIFDVSSFGGQDGIIAKVFTSYNIEFGRPFGTVNGFEAWQEEINDLTSTLQVMKGAGLLSDGADFAAALVGMGEDGIITFLGSINKSEILRPIIAETAYNAIVSSLAGFGGEYVENLVKGQIEDKYPWLHNQANPINPLDTEANYNIHIQFIAKLLDGNATLDDVPQL